MRSPRLSAALLTAIIPFAACAGGPTSPPPGNGLALIEVTPSPLDLPVGGSGSVSATARDGAGNALSGVPVTWSTLNTAIATVDNAGLVLGISPGTTNVIARSGSVQGAGVVNVSQGVVSLEIVPGSATTTVGGSVSFSVVARDVHGVVVAPPAVTWSSGSPQIATIGAASGIAVGVAIGTTQIGASAGSLTAPPATLTVTAVQTGPCDGIAQQDTFNADISMDWASSTTVNGLLIQAEHHAHIVTVLRQSTPGSPHWEAQPEGDGKIDDSETETQPPNRKARIQAGGKFSAASGGLPGPPVTLDVDLTTCTYQYTTTPWLDATYTDFDGTTSDAPSAIGTLSSGPIAIGTGILNWRQLGLSDVSGDIDFPAHSLLWLVSNAANALVPYYIPSAYGALMFGSQAGAAEAGQGLANVSWTILR